MRSPLSFILAAAPYVAAFPRFGGASGLSTSSVQQARYKDYDTSTLHPKHFVYQAPQLGDSRGPCPIMNTMANHDFVPHNGRNISREPFITACMQGLGLSHDFAAQIFETALADIATANPRLNSTTFDIWMLHNTHGIVEHDGSLARQDIFFDPSSQFDPATFANLLSYLGPSPGIDLPGLAHARARHAWHMSAANPRFSIAPAAVPVIVGENAMLLGIFGKGNATSPVVDRAHFEFFFRREEFPVRLGWTPNRGVGPEISAIVQSMIAQSPAGVPLTFSPAAAAAAAAA
ncbi:uncharacterized protein L3040_008026 [Drepanopeziza brunnea f. sp. 'multigermtubi']|uniref:uncharacterized protein n=1 Tax=Drepanopeziza brunnea f. sp. 'multigermtubi' TaxID=698441 RepID=UPI002393607D|nr:hypothetical protein L3040_008026 [Drepanopeziza brunnea f. sp. 'multigermtubi']